jgi:hypothetical protein
VTDTPEPGNGCLIVVAWVLAVGRLALAGIGAILLIAYLLHEIGRGLVNY